MKKLKLFAIGMLVVFAAVGGVSAAERPTYADKARNCKVDNVNDLEAAISAKWVDGDGYASCEEIIIKPNSNITLDRDLTFNGESNLNAKSGNIVLDLNGHTITFTDYNNFAIWNKANVLLKNGNIVQKSNGWSAIDVMNNASLETSALNVTVSGNVDYDEDDKTYTYPYAFDVSGLDEGEEATLVVSADTVVNVPNGNGLKLESYAKVVLDGTWNTYGSLVVDDNGATNTTYVKFLGGNYNAEHGVTVPIIRGNWTFDGGTFTSNDTVAIYIQKPVKKNGQAAAKKAQSVKINGGFFETKNRLSKTILAGELTKFVTGGVFKAPIISDELASEYVAANVKTVVENGVTYVGNEYTITVTDGTNGKVKADKAKAISGQVVTLTALADNDYVLDAFTVTDEKGNAIEVVDGKFVMPASNVTVKATFKSVAAESTKITTEIPSADDVVTTDEETSNVLTETLKNTKDEKLKKLLENQDVTVELKAEETKVNEDEMKKFADALPNATISKYLDISVLVKSGNETYNLHELDEEITLTVKIPDNLPEVKEGYTRVYYILREHDGKVEKLKTILSDDGTELSFATDKFSTYVLAYEDQANAGTNPDTLDNIGSYLMISAIACTGLIALGYSIKKKLEN